ncbi:hypothetical protein SSX86_027174 [Deinandra increscens subsp. villosa]|uniref:Mei2-like C-terminal RNA recognition motif domain-containing protein n=1 Tax=Deinandra increscens subsp. villosa TaxID=3103831 RepID=A0AAP0GNT3_9ASTR
MEHLHPRRLNPNAPPFFPSTFRHLRPPPPPPATTVSKKKKKKSVRFSLTPVPKGPRNRLPAFTPSCRPPAAGIRRFREIIPLNPDDDSSTSVMLRNIPNNYTRALLVEFLEDHCRTENEKEDNLVRSAFDFVYLPVDFKQRLNAGYAFVNFTTSEAAWRFRVCVKGKPWKLFQSRKIADVTRARIQGKDALMGHFERIRLCSPSSDYLPVWFEPARDGVEPAGSARVKMHTIGEVAASVRSKKTEGSTGALSGPKEASPLITTLFRNCYERPAAAYGGVVADGSELAVEEERATEVTEHSEISHVGDQTSGIDYNGASEVFVEEEEEKPRDEGYLGLLIEAAQLILGDDSDPEPDGKPPICKAEPRWSKSKFVDAPATESGEGAKRRQQFYISQCKIADFEMKLIDIDSEHILAFLKLNIMSLCCRSDTETRWLSRWYGGRRRPANQSQSEGIILLPTFV